MRADSYLSTTTREVGDYEDVTVLSAIKRYTDIMVAARDARDQLIITNPQISTRAIAMCTDIGHTQVWRIRQDHHE